MADHPPPEVFNNQLKYFQDSREAIKILEERLKNSDQDFIMEDGKKITAREISLFKNSLQCQYTSIGGQGDVFKQN